MINIDLDTPSHNCSCTFEPFSLKFHNSVKILQNAIVSPLKYWNKVILKYVK